MIRPKKETEGLLLSFTKILKSLCNKLIEKQKEH